ncbi:PEP-CTERM sorting domain-containing protein [Massilia pinisoli]|uniref:PEP-CTERM sorting domain-containing protein n=1 Tax=Massilia pinisoli TaxID=1772194 RepID=A0ABT1ZSM3_9BURK|nr:PEP-CTERM sorting domain-containing protein [Massilia pinisoli]MCS0582871.1 PEP-CTERM sorting domain-containing protein [Massilia pinisoli]
MKTKALSAALGVVLSLASAVAAAGSNLVTNGDFENWSAGWTTNGMEFYSSPGIGHAGDLVILTGCRGENCTSTLGSGAYFRQEIDTEVGSSYDLSLWLSENATGTSELSVFWNGALVRDIVNPANDTTRTGMVQFTFSGLVAASSRTALEIHGRQDPRFMFFDDISVTKTESVPEPSSVTIVGLGFFAMLMFRRRIR